VPAVSARLDAASTRLYLGLQKRLVQNFAEVRSVVREAAQKKSGDAVELGQLPRFG
jgi:hypothetical protein